MKLEGIHHVTAITGDAPRNVDFYARVLGLRLVKKTVNQDDPTVYHLFYADELGSPGADVTFFEYPGARRGRHGDGMIHTIVWRVGTDDALAFWEERLAGEGVTTERSPGRLRLADPEGIGIELAVVETDDEPLVAEAPDIPREHALQGFDGVRAYASDPARSATVLRDAFGFRADGDRRFELRGDSRGSFYAYDVPPPDRGYGGAGTVHHVAWSSTMEDHAAWRERAREHGLSPTPIIDRFWFRSVYFREPSGVLFEIATMGPGFATDEPVEHLGESLVLPPDFEHLRERIEPVLTPIVNPRQAARA